MIKFCLDVRNLFTEYHPDHACVVAQRYDHQEELENAKTVANVEEEVNIVHIDVQVPLETGIVIYLANHILLVPILEEIDHELHVVYLHGRHYSDDLNQVEKAPGFVLAHV